MSVSGTLGLVPSQLTVNVRMWTTTGGAMSERIYLSSPDVGVLEENSVLSAMRSGWVAPLGPEVDAFEGEIAARVGVQHAVALNTGTAALHLGLISLGVQPGDIVVTSTMTFAATTNAIVYTGAKPFFIDCEPDTANMDVLLLNDALKTFAANGQRVAAIVPVDMLGKAVNYTEILNTAQKFGIPVLSDAAESLGAVHRGKPAGSFGAASIVSFNGNKIMTTSGGGMFLTDDERLAQRVRYLSTQARQPVTHYEHVDVGYNYRLSNILAALGRAQLQRLDEMIGRRKQLRRRYKEFFANVDGVSVLGSVGDESDNAWLTAIQIDSSVAGWTPDNLREHLSRLNIESRPVWKPMHLQPVFENYDGLISGSAEHLFETCLTLPSGSALSGEQIDFVFEAIYSFVRRH